MAAPSQAFLAAHPVFAKAYATGDRAVWGAWLQAHPAINTAFRADIARTTTTATATAPQATGSVTAAPTGYAALSGSDRDWVDELTNLFTTNGLGALAGTLTSLVQDGYAGPALSLKLTDTDAYRQRFAANEARKKAGLPVLSPAEYLSTERQYRQLMQQAGMPAGFYDDPSDFQKFLENDTSPAEVQSRLQGAVSLAKKTDAGYRKMLSDTFGIGLTDGDIAAYLLDPERALPVLQRQVESVGIADAARRQGLGYSAERANQLAELGITGDQAQQAYGQVAQATGAYGKAGDAFGIDYGQRQAEDELLLGSDAARQERERVDTTFKAFNPGATSKKSSKSLSDDTSGSY